MEPCESDLRYCTLFMDEDTSDLEVKLEPGGRIYPAHTKVLLKHVQLEDFDCRVRPLFPGVWQLTVKNVEHRHVKQFLRFVYTSVLPTLWSDVLQVLRVADQFGAKLVVRSCHDALVRMVDINNVLYLFEQSGKLDLNNLESLCLNLICRLGFFFLSHEQFQDLSRERMTRIISSNDLVVERELDVFLALEQWLRSNPRQPGFSSRPATDAHLLKYIRWNLIDSVFHADILNGRVPPEFTKEFVHYTYSRRGRNESFSCLRFCRVVELETFCKSSGFVKVPRENAFSMSCVKMTSVNSAPVFVMGADLNLRLESPMTSPGSSVADDIVFSCYKYTGTEQVEASYDCQFKMGLVVAEIVRCEFSGPIVLGENETMELFLSVGGEDVRVRMASASSIVLKQKCLPISEGRFFIFGSEILAVKRLYVL